MLQGLAHGFFCTMIFDLDFYFEQKELFSFSSKHSQHFPHKVHSEQPSKLLHEIYDFEIIDF